MKAIHAILTGIAVGMILCRAAVCGASLDTNRIEQITGLKGGWSEVEGVFKVTQARSDVAVKVDEWRMPPFMGLTSWAAFQAGKTNSAMVMGDFVMFEDEVNPVMSAALENGLEVTALHNHFFHADPQVYFMHIGGEGTVDKLATGVKAALEKMKEVRAANSSPAKSFGGNIPGRARAGARRHSAPGCGDPCGGRRAGAGRAWSRHTLVESTARPHRLRAGLAFGRADRGCHGVPCGHQARGNHRHPRSIFHRGCAPG